MPNPRQPIDSEREDMSKSRINDPTRREASPLELDDDDLETSEPELDDEEDMDY